MSNRSVVMLTRDYKPNIGGVANHIYFVSKELVSMGYSVSVVFIHDGNKDYRFDYEDSGIAIIDVEYSRSGSKLFNALKLIAHYRREIKLIPKKSIIHQHDYIGGRIPVLFSRLRGDYFWTNHSSHFLKDIRSKNVLKLAILKVLFFQSKKIITVSQEIDIESQKLWNGKTVYIPNGVDPELFKPENRRKADEKIIVLCPRRVVEKNGVKFFVMAAQEIIKVNHRKDIVFHIVGDESNNSSSEDYISEVRRLADPLGESIQFLGNLSIEQMMKAYDECDIVVIPSLIEAISLSALEAMSMEKPVIASDVGGLSEIFRHRENGFLVKSGDAKDIAKHIIELADNPELRKNIGSMARQDVKKRYSWRICAEKLAREYEG